MNEFRFEGIVIGYENWGDTDRIFSFYTPYFGKLETVARGVRHEKSKLKGHLELLTRGQFIAASGRARAVLTDALAVETYLKLRAVPEHVYLGTFVASLYDQNTFPAMPDEQLWELLCKELEWLDAAPKQTSELQAHFLDFAAKFLKALGYGGGASQRRARVAELDSRFHASELTGPLPSTALAFLQNFGG